MIVDFVFNAQSTMTVGLYQGELKDEPNTN